MSNWEGQYSWYFPPGQMDRTLDQGLWFTNPTLYQGDPAHYTGYPNAVPVTTPTLSDGLPASGINSTPAKGMSTSLTEDHWVSMKDTIKKIYITENKSLKVLGKIMKEEYNFSATPDMYGNGFKRKWKPEFNKNETKNNGGLIPDEGDREARARCRTDRADIPQHVVPASTSRDRLQQIIQTILGRLFQWNQANWSINDAFFEAPGGRPYPQGKSWRLLSQMSNNIILLSRNGFQTRMNYALQNLLASCADTCSYEEPDFLVYFWRLCLCLRDFRPRGEQRVKKHEFRLLRLFLNFICVQLEKSLPNHAFLPLATWLKGVLVEWPKMFKAEIGWAYHYTITCFAATVTHSSHPLILTMLVHHQSYWRKAQISELPPIGECYEATQNRLQGAFNKHDAVQVSLKADLFLSLPTEAPAQDPAVEENTAEEILALKKSTAKEILGLTDEHCTPKEFEPSLQWDQRVHAYAICTEWLATHLFESGASQDGEEGYGYLNRAIESLKQGDYECRIWAAALSRRLKLWLELEKRYKKAPRLTKDNRKSTFERKPSNAKGGGDQRGLLLDPDEGNEHKKSRSKKFENEIARLHAIKLMIPESPIERVGSYHLKGSRAHQRLKRKGEEAGLLPALERFIMTMLFVPGQRDL